MNDFTVITQEDELSVVDAENFDIACRLASFATQLDESKYLLDTEFYEMAVSCVEDMHTIAQIMAGARVGEIYDMSEEEA